MFLVAFDTAREKFLDRRFSLCDRRKMNYNFRDMTLETKTHSVPKILQNSR